jgi:hypothetical protein
MSMPNDLDDIERVAITLVAQIGRSAVLLVREQAELSDALPDLPSAETWRDIADAIDRLRPTPLTTLPQH